MSDNQDHNPKQIRISFFQPVDIIVWVLVLLFFGGSAIISHGSLKSTFLGAMGIVAVMFLVSLAIEIIIETLRDIRGLGTVTGFITNGPEALVLIVGLMVGDVLFAASTPLGSNVINPLMLVAAALIAGKLSPILKTCPGYFGICVGLTAAMATGFFFIPQKAYPIWLVLALVISVILFIKRPKESAQNDKEERTLSRVWLIPSIMVLVLVGYVLDPVVSYTAESSHAPKGVIGFFVLAALTSWPEFKSTLTLLRREKTMAAMLNIIVSNITNIWLAVGGVFIYLLF